MVSLVTGAGGFLGRHVVLELLHRGEKARALLQHDGGLAGLDPSNVETAVGDLLDCESLSRAVSGVEVVYHCAAKLPGKAADQEIWNVNVAGTQNLVAACLRHGVRRLVNVSTDSVYGDGDHLGVREEAPLQPEYFPEGIYPRSKLEAERLSLQAFHERDLEVSILRPCLMYGPGYSAGNEILLRWASKRRHWLVNGGQARISLLYVADAARAVVLAGTRPEAVGECFNLSDGRSYSRREILECLAQVAGTRKTLLDLPAAVLLPAFRLLHALLREPDGPQSRFDPRHILFMSRHHVVDCGKAMRVLGYRPQVFLREGLEKTFAWLARPEWPPPETPS